MRSLFTFLKAHSLVILLWLLLIIIAGSVRPLFYSNEEMHYASVAWEMWQHHSFILPIEGGQPYAEKGPLLFWLFHLGWLFLGVSTWWPRLLPELFALGCLLLSGVFAERFWPSEKTIARLVPILILGSFTWCGKITVMRFDVITTFFIMTALFSMVLSIEVHKKYWLLFSICITLGLLTKGPVVLIFILPAALGARWWAKPLYAWKSVYFYLGGAFLLGIIFVAFWLVPAVIKGGGDYAYALLFSRSIGRATSQPFSHQIWSYYFFILALMLLPWIIWLPFWKSFILLYQKMKLEGFDRGLRFLTLVIGCSFLFLTLVAEKGLRYFLPALPFISLFVTYALVKFPVAIKRGNQFLISSCYFLVGLLYLCIPYLLSGKMQTKYFWLIEMPSVWGVGFLGIGLFWLCWQEKSLIKIINGLTISTVLFWAFYHLSVIKTQAYYGDWWPLAQQVSNLQAAGYPIGFVGSTQVLEFFGRLPRPLECIKKDQIKNWIQQDSPYRMANKA